MFEHYKKPLLPITEYRKRILRNFLWAVYMITGALTIGTVGYHFTANLSWIDSFYNASMILTGMGPANILTTNGAKIFSSLYAIFSGVLFLSTIAVMMAPIAHRLLHRFHLDEE